MGRDERRRERKEAQARGILVRPGKEKGLGSYAQPGQLEPMAGKIMSFLPDTWNVPIKPGQRFVDIDTIKGTVWNEIAVSPDNRFIAIVQHGSRNVILVWDMERGEKKEFPLEKDMGTYFDKIAFQSGDQLIALTDKKMYKIDINALKVIKEIGIAHYGLFKDDLEKGFVFAFSLDGNYLIALPDDGSVCGVWDVATGKLVKKKEGATFLFSGSKYKIDEEGKARVITPSLAIGRFNTQVIGWLPDGIRVLAKEEDPDDLGVVYQIWNTDTIKKEHEHQLSLFRTISFINAVVSPDGHYILYFVTKEGGRGIALWVYDLNWEAPEEERSQF